MYHVYRICYCWIDTQSFVVSVRLIIGMYHHFTHFMSIHCIDIIMYIWRHYGLVQLILVIFSVFSTLYRRFHTKSAGDWMHHFEKEFASIPVLVCLTHADRLYEDNFKDSIPVCQPDKLPEIRYLVKQELEV